jgi:hypothetical protein
VGGFAVIRTCYDWRQTAIRRLLNRQFEDPQVNEHSAAKPRFVWLLPVTFGLTTVFPWLWSVSEHRAEMRTALWTDDTTIQRPQDKSLVQSDLRAH